METSDGIETIDPYSVDPATLTIGRRYYVPTNEPGGINRTHLTIYDGLDAKTGYPHFTCDQDCPIRASVKGQARPARFVFVSLHRAGDGSHRPSKKG